MPKNTQEGLAMNEEISRQRQKVADDLHGLVELLGQRDLPFEAAQQNIATIAALNYMQEWFDIISNFLQEEGGEIGL